MSAITDLVQQHLGENGLAQLSQHLGVDPGTAEAAVSAALPALVSAASTGTAQPAGVTVPSAADGALGGAASGLLGNLFGGNHGAVAQQVSRHSGLDLHQAEKALLFLAPIVLARLAQQRQQGGAGVAPAAAPKAAAPTAAAPGSPAPQPEAEPERSGLGSIIGAVERIFHKDG
jgi:hypothetical protein